MSKDGIDNNAIGSIIIQKNTSHTPQITVNHTQNGIKLRGDDAIVRYNHIYGFTNLASNPTVSAPCGILLDGHRNKVYYNLVDGVSDQSRLARGISLEGLGDDRYVFNNTVVNISGYALVSYGNTSGSTGNLVRNNILSSNG